MSEPSDVDRGFLCFVFECGGAEGFYFSVGFADHYFSLSSGKNLFVNSLKRNSPQTTMTVNSQESWIDQSLNALGGIPI